MINYIKAIKFNQKGVECLYAGKPLVSLPYFEKAYKIFKKLNNTKRIAETAHYMGENLCDLGEKEKGLKFFEEAFQKSVDCHHKKLKHSAIMNVCSFNIELNNRLDAISLLEKYRPEVDSPKQIKWLVEVDYVLGKAHMIQGRQEKALEYFGKPLYYHAVMGNLEEVANIYKCIAEVYKDLNSYFSATDIVENGLALSWKASLFDVYLEFIYLKLELLCLMGYNEQALEIIFMIEAYDCMHRHNIRLQLKKIHTLFLKNEISKMREAIAQTEVNCESELSDILYAAQITYFKYCMLEKEQKHGKCIEIIKKSIEAHKKMKCHDLLAKDYLMLAKAYLNKGNDEKARTVLRSGFGDEDRIVNFGWQFIHLYALSIRRKSINKSIDLLKKSVDHFENERNLSELSTRHYLVTQEFEPYSDLIALLVKSNRLEEAVHYAERSRCRTFFEYHDDYSKKVREMENRVVKTRDGVPISLNNMKTEFMLPEKTERELRRKYPGIDFSNIGTEVWEVGKAASGVIKTIKDKTQAAEYRNIKQGNINYIDYKKICRDYCDLLTNKQLLAYYHALENRLILFLFCKNNLLSVKTIPIRLEDLKEMGEEIRLGLSSNKDKRTYRIPDSFFQLSSEIVGSISKTTKKYEEIVFVSHSVLNHLPLNALCYQTFEEGKRKLKYLIEDYAISYAHSLEMLKHSKQLANAKKDNTLVIGNPKPPGDLSFGLQEALYISRGCNAKSLLHEKASKNLVQTESYNKDIIHFACHGVFKERNLKRSGIILSDHEVLNINEIYSLPICANLVAITACDSGGLNVNKLDDWNSLVRAFLKGSKSVIASLWKCEDQSTMQITISFYNHWYFNGMSKSKALQQSQIIHLQDARRKAKEAKEPIGTLDFQGNYNYKLHPYFWAGLQLYGDWE